MNSPGTLIVKTYSIKKSIGKGLYPLAIIFVVEITHAILAGTGITVEKTVLYEAAAAGYATIMALVNYIKNRKK